MTVCFDERVDLASYALGLLDDHDATRVENHLAECDGCAEELEALLPTVGVMSTVDLDMLQLSGVDRSSLLVANDSLDENAGPAAAPGDEDADIVSILGGRHQRREHAAKRERTSRYAEHGGVAARGGAVAWARRRPLALLVAAAVVVLMAGLVFTFTPTGKNKVSAGSQSSAAPTGNPTAGTDGTYLWQANKQTGTRLDLTMAGRPWGTHFSFSITEDQGPLRCRLVTVDSHGTIETVSSWQVPAAGYGTPAHPGRLELQANSSLSPNEIAKVQVQEIDPTGKATTLIDIPTAK